jgi:acetylornithine deacetylase/succinyl-diaminopimelate desuccinylase-like protein
LAAAEAALYIERRCTGTPTLVGTVGMVEALPGAMNVIPGLARISIDIRAGDDTVRDAAAKDVLAEIEAIGRRRNIGISVEELYTTPATPCDPRLMRAVDEAIKAQGLEGMRLPSGAGHDAMTIAHICPVGMIFMRCTRGISHNPLEAVLPEDVELATAALLHVVENFDPQTFAA